MSTSLSTILMVILFKPLDPLSLFMEVLFTACNIQQITLLSVCRSCDSSMTSYLTMFLIRKSRDRLVSEQSFTVNAFLYNRYPSILLGQFFIYWPFLTLIFMKPWFQGCWTLVGFLSMHRLSNSLNMNSIRKITPSHLIECKYSMGILKIQVSGIWIRAKSHC